MACLVHHPQRLPLCLTQRHSAQRRKVSLRGSAPRATRRGRRARDGDTLGIGLCFFRAVFVQVGPPDHGHLHAELWKCWFPGRPLAPPPPPGTPIHTNAGRPHTPPVSLSPHSPFPASPGLYVLPLLAFPTSSSSFRLPEASPLAPSQSRKSERPAPGLSLHPSAVSALPREPRYLDLVVEELG